MRRLIVLLALLAPSLTLAASHFVGTWRITLAPGTEAIRVQEIAYPVWLRIAENNSALTIEYRDQHDVRCQVTELLQMNAGRDVIFSACGTTKHPDSFAPIQHLKMVDGKLRGVVTTRFKLFEWVGVPIY